MRVIGVGAAIVLLVILLPFLALIALAICCSSRGPAIYRQTRVGLCQKTFVLLKFRTMRTAVGGPDVTIGRDSRITGVGRVLRALKLDELPQLLNIVKGEMSFVGPRPEVPRYVALYPADKRELVYSVRPGLTDLASLVFIDESRLIGEAADPERYYVDVQIPAKVNLAAQYVVHRSWWLDLRIIVATLTGIIGWRWIPAPWSDQRLD